MPNCYPDYCTKQGTQDNIEVEEFIRDAETTFVIQAQGHISRLELRQCEQDDLVQYARIHAWQGWIAGVGRGLSGDDLHNYALGAASRGMRWQVSRLLKDPWRTVLPLPSDGDA